MVEKFMPLVNYLLSKMQKKTYHMFIDQNMWMCTIFDHKMFTKSWDSRYVVNCPN